ncbi:hypothetical protein HAX54_034507 [Datura stramonium]|uniref:Uncharacterized protein n=1 Tax=Datura stramonium TaxID=4076 RepID=A0ABS8VFN5_DATST|nr:hypothetical protein [Datura stramonium]
MVKDHEVSIRKLEERMNLLASQMKSRPSMTTQEPLKGDITPIPRNKLYLDLKNRKTPPSQPSINVPPVLELKPLHAHLKYTYLGSNETLSPIVVG